MKEHGSEIKVAGFLIQWAALNPLTPMSDQDRISPYNINTISSRQVTRIKKNNNKIIS